VDLFRQGPEAGSELISNRRVGGWRGSPTLPAYAIVGIILARGDELVLKLRRPFRCAGDLGIVVGPLLFLSERSFKLASAASAASHASASSPRLLAWFAAELSRLAIDRHTRS